MILERTKKTRVILAAILLLASIIIDLIYGQSLLLNILLLVAWFVAGLDVIYQAILNLKGKMLLAEHFLMSLATIGAIAIGEYKEAAMVMVLFQIGELLQDAAIDKSRESIAELLDIAAPTAFRLENGDSVEIDPDEIVEGDLLEVRAGQKIPVDGKVIKGSTSLDMSALTGESMPVNVGVGNEVLSGSINGEGWIVIEASKTAYDSTAMRIIEMLEEATENKAETESFITRFAKIYTPIVVGFALFLAFILPLFIKDAVFADWFKRGLIFLVVSCPCAFVVSVPMSFVMGLGASSKLGILVKGGNVFEKINEINVLATDKTGTITEGKFKVESEYVNPDIDRDEFLSIFNQIESASNHPIAKAIKDYCTSQAISNSIEFDNISNVEGRGLRANKGNTQYILGNRTFMTENGFDKKLEPLNIEEGVGVVVHLAMTNPESKYLGNFTIKDSIKPTAKEVIHDIHKYVNKIVMLTGDNELVARDVAEKTSIDNYEAQLLPQDKLEWVQNEMKNPANQVAFVGDGLNDAPVIAASDVGIAMGGIGSDATIEASDVVLVNDDLKSIPRIFRLANDTIKIAKQNIWLSLGIKVIFLIMSAFGLTQMWMAVFADVGVTLLAIANTFRLYFLPSKLLKE